MKLWTQLALCLTLTGVAAAEDWKGPLSRRSLDRAAEAAGFEVKSVSAEIPGAVRSRLPFVTIDYDAPLLKDLREKHDLAGVIANAPDEFTAQLLLKDWVSRQIENGTPRHSPRSALEILDLASRGEKFWCTYFAITYQQAALALGWQARHVGVDRKHGPVGMQSTHHGVAEVWSNQFQKWVVMDGQSNLHFEKKGVPLSAWEIRAEWLKNKGADVDHIVGAPPDTVEKNPAMVWPVPDEDEIATYFWVYVEDHAEFFNENSRKVFPQDQHNASEIWYQNDDETNRGVMHRGYISGVFLPTSRIGDAYWTVGVVEASIAGVSPGAIEFTLDTYRPYLTHYELSTDGETWGKVPDPKSVDWRLSAGWNLLRLRTAGKGGVLGPEAGVALYLER